MDIKFVILTGTKNELEIISKLLQNIGCQIIDDQKTQDISRSFILRNITCDEIEIIKSPLAKIQQDNASIAEEILGPGAKTGILSTGGKSGRMNRECGK